MNFKGNKKWKCRPEELMQSQHENRPKREENQIAICLVILSTTLKKFKIVISVSHMKKELSDVDKYIN